MSEINVEFVEHPTFARKISKFSKKYDGGIGYKNLKNLLEKHFDPIDPQIKFSPKVLKPINRVGANVEVYKIIMAVKNLRQGQSPRVCIWRVGNLIYFLCFGTHIDNYKDSELKKLVKKRIKDLDPSVQFD